MTGFLVDQLVVTPAMIDLAHSPLAGHLETPTFVLGAFNPGMTRLPNGNLLLMVRVAEALQTPIMTDHVHAVRWHEGRYVLDAWPLELADTADPRKFLLHGGGWKVMALTSLSWLLPIELSRDGLQIEEIHYDRVLSPQGPWQCYGLEDARISRVDDRYWMTTCSVSPERHSTTLYSSHDALDWTFEGIVLDHQNKDMLIFEGRIEGQYWAQTRPLGDLYFAYPPGSEWRAGPSINLATSPDAKHWKPHLEPGLRPRSGTVATARMGGGAPPILTEIAGRRGWLSLWHGVEPKEVIGIYRTYWVLMDEHDPAKIIASSDNALLEPNPRLTEPLKEQMYLDGVVFTTGIVEDGDRYIVASGEADLACRITHIPKTAIDHRH